MITLPASKANIWAVPNGCRAYGKMVQPYRNQGNDSQDILEGLAVHTMAQQCLIVGIDPATFAGKTIDGVMVNNDMIAAVSLYVAVVKPHMDASTSCGVETSIPTDTGSPVIVDAWAYYLETKTLHVWDLKYGHTVVEAIDNHTLVIYADAIKKKQSLRVSAWEFGIVQPRPFHPAGPSRTWSPGLEEYLAIDERIKLARIECQEEYPPCTSGPHCRKCGARHACMTAHNASMSAIDLVGEAFAHEFDENAIGYELDLLTRASKAIELRLTGLETQATEMIRAGRNVAGWGLQPGRSSLKWTAPVDQVISMGEMLGLEVAKPLGVITPSQAIKAGMPAAMVTSMAEKPPAKLGLKRVKQEDLKRIFGVL